MGRYFDIEQKIVSNIIRLLWAPKAFKVQHGDTLLIGETDRKGRNTVFSAITPDNVVCNFQAAEYPPHAGEPFGAFEPDDEATLSPTAMARVQHALEGNFPESLTVLSLWGAGGKAEYFACGQTQEWCTLYFDFNRYGRRGLSVEVNWSACGSRPPEDAAAFARIVTQAARDAHSITVRGQEEMRAYARMANGEELTPARMEEIIRQILSDPSGSHVPLPSLYEQPASDLGI